MSVLLPAFLWRARDLSLDALTGQIGTCIRAATATMTDMAGNTLTVQNDQLRLEAIDTNADSILDALVYKPAGATTDYLDWPLPIVPQALTLYIRLYNRGAPGSTAAVAALSAATPEMRIAKTTSNTYQLIHHNGTSAVTSTSSAPSSGQLVELRAVLRSTGVVQLYSSFAGASEASATASSSNTLNAAFGGTTFRLAGGSAGNSVNDDLLLAAVILGEPTLAACRTLT